VSANVDEDSQWSQGLISAVSNRTSWIGSSVDNCSYNDCVWSWVWSCFKWVTT